MFRYKSLFPLYPQVGCCGWIRLVQLGNAFPGFGFDLGLANFIIGEMTGFSLFNEGYYDGAFEDIPEKKQDRAEDTADC